ncbi:MAG TPA: hypothetical protein PKY30_07945 [Myxococcota bacterium]|nr:hypothetical protein [Myxococcota bacterium]
MSNPRTPQVKRTKRTYWNEPTMGAWESVYLFEVVRGLSITGGAAEVSNNDFSDNSGYGMVCTSVSLTTCNTNDLSNNTMGAHSGCDDACGSF